jgi:hypothetical protein
MDGTCSTHGRSETKFWLENLLGRDHFVDTSVYGRIISKQILKEIDCEGAGWTNLAQDGA